MERGGLGGVGKWRWPTRSANGKPDTLSGAVVGLLHIALFLPPFGARRQQVERAQGVCRPLRATFNLPPLPSAATYGAAGLGGIPAPTREARVSPARVSGPHYWSDGSSCAPPLHPFLNAEKALGSRGTRSHPKTSYSLAG